MLKFLQKSLPVLAIAGAGFAANAQEISENFQTWTEQNLKFTAPSTTATDAEGTCDKDIIGGVESLGHGLMNAPITLITKTVAYGTTSVTYTLTNAGVVPNCLPKSAYNSASSPSPTKEYNTALSRGYVELQKSTDGSVFGTLETSPIARVESVYLTMSATGTGKPFSLQTSIDGGSTWVTALADACGKPGNVYNVPVQLSDVKLRVAATTDVMRIHDFNVYFTPLSIKEGEWYSLGAKVRAESNKVIVSASYNGTVEIVNINGTVVGQTNLTAGVESTVSVPASGMYVVRLATASKMASTKVIVQ